MFQRRHICPVCSVNTCWVESGVAVTTGFFQPERRFSWVEQTMRGTGRSWLSRPRGLGQTGSQWVTLRPSAAGALFVDGGPGSSQEGLFQNNQLMRPESSRAAIQRALAGAAKARALAM